MPLYMAQFAYTVEAWAAFTKNPENRTAALQNLAKKVGAKVEALYYSFGDYDGFVIIDAPDDLGRHPNPAIGRHLKTGHRG